MILKNIFTKQGKCHVCEKVKKVCQECEECYSSGFDIDKQIKFLQKLKREAKQGDKE